MRRRAVVSNAHGRDREKRRILAIPWRSTRQMANGAAAALWTTLAARTNCTCAREPESTPRYALARDRRRTPYTPARFNILLLLLYAYYYIISYVCKGFFSSLVRRRCLVYIYIYNNAYIPSRTRSDLHNTVSATHWILFFCTTTSPYIV